MVTGRAGRSVRVAMVSPYDVDVPGGVQSHVRQLADHLRRRGDDVHIVAPGTHERGGTTLVGGSIGLPFNDSVAPIALDPRVVGRVRSILAELAPDVVHVHEPMVPIVSLAAATSRVAPVVATFHAWSDRDLAYRLARPVVRRVVAGLAARIAVSEAAAEYHSAATGSSRASFRVIPNGVEVARFAEAHPFASLQATPSLLFVGRLEPRKGLSDLVTAFVRCKQQHPDLRLYVVGEGPERTRAQEQLPVRLRSDVVFLGRVDAHELPRLYASADLYVSPATGGESFGIVLAEAMAAGATVVATDIPGYRSVVTDGVDGVLVPPSDPVTLARTLSELLSTPARRSALRDQARRGVARFDWTVVADRVRDTYVDVLAD